MNDRSKFKKLENGEELHLDYRKGNLRLACCDCGLVHTIAFHVYRGGVLGIAMERDKRATAQLRHHDFGYLQQDGSARKYHLERKNGALYHL